MKMFEALNFSEESTPQRSCETNNSERHSECSDFGFMKEPNIPSEKFENLLEHNANIVTAALNGALRHDTESPVIPSSDEEMSLECETPGLTFTESELHQTCDISRITETVESIRVTSEETQYLLEHGANTVIAALNDSLPHDNESSDLPSHDEEMSLECETPRFTSTEATELHQIPDICRTRETVEVLYVISEEIESMLEHNANIVIRRINNS
jgi:hypothetical protein